MNEIDIILKYIASPENVGESSKTLSRYYIRQIKEATGKLVSNNSIVYVVIHLLHNPFELDQDGQIVFPFNLRLIPLPNLNSKMQLQPTKRLRFELLQQTHDLKPQTFSLRFILDLKENCFVLLAELRSHRARSNFVPFPGVHLNKIIGYVIIKDKDDFSPEILEIFEPNKGYGTEVVKELERNMIGRTIFICSLKQSVKFWTKLGYKPTKLNQYYKQIYF